MTYDVWGFSHQSVISLRWITGHGVGAGVSTTVIPVGRGADTTQHMCHNTWNILQYYQHPILYLHSVIVCLSVCSSVSLS